MKRAFAAFMRQMKESARDGGPEIAADIEEICDSIRLGKDLARARKRKKLKQSQVATRARITQADVSKIELGLANSTISTLSAVAAAVGMELHLRELLRPRLSDDL